MKSLGPQERAVAKGSRNAVGIDGDVGERGDKRRRLPKQRRSHACLQEEGGREEMRGGCIGGGGGGGGLSRTTVRLGRS